mgnify:CR=1 FL=1
MRVLGPPCSVSCRLLCGLQHAEGPAHLGHLLLLNLGHPAKSLQTLRHSLQTGTLGQSSGSLPQFWLCCNGCPWDWPRRGWRSWPASCTPPRPWARSRTACCSTATSRAACWPLILSNSSIQQQPWAVDSVHSVHRTRLYWTRLDCNKRWTRLYCTELLTRLYWTRHGCTALDG